MSSATTAIASGNDVAAEGSARLLGRAGAGKVADPANALSASYNPAQFVLLDGVQVAGSLAYMGPIGDPQITTALGTTDGGDFFDKLPIGGAAVSAKVAPNVAVALSATPGFGLVVDYGSDFAAAPLVARADLKSVAIAPALSVALTEKLSFGLAPIIELAMLDYRSAVPGVGTVDRDYDPDVALGAQFGLRYAPDPLTNIGLTFRLSPDHDYSGEIVSGFSGPSDYAIDSPNILELGIRREIPDVATVFLGVSWLGWSVVEQTVAEEPDNPLGDVVAPRNWNDGWRFGIGVERELNDRLTGRFGVVYSTNFVDATRRVPDVPFDAQWRIGAGLTYALSDAVDLHVGYQYADLGANRVNLSAADYGGLAVSGSLDSRAHVVGLEISRRF